MPFSSKTLAWFRAAVLLALVALFTSLSRHAFIDDALIYARYVRNALAGQGLVFNPGEHINALTSPFFSYLVLGGAALAHGHVLGITSVVSGASLFATCLLAESMIPFAGLLLACTGYFYSLVGMESSTFLCMLLLNIWLLERNRYNLLPVSALLLLLTRFEGGALLMALGVVLYRRRRWPSFHAYLPALLLVAVYLALNHHWYGSFLPASANAKIGQGRSELWGRWPLSFYKTAYQLKPEFLPTLFVVILVTVLAPFGVYKLRQTSIPHLLLPFLILLLGFYTLCNIPGYKWYYAPFIASAMLFACAALPPKPVIAFAATVVLAYSARAAFHHYAPTRASSPTEGYPAISAWLEANARPGVRLESAEIGTLGWDCPHCQVLGILGLTLPKNADHIAHRDLRSWLNEDRPEYIVVHFSPWSFEDVAKQSPDYEPVPVSFGPSAFLLHRKRIATAAIHTQAAHEACTWKAQTRSPATPVN